VIDWSDSVSQEVHCEFVFLKAAPFHESNLPLDEYESRRQYLKQYWQKLEFEHYDEQHDLMWTENWSCPEWLRSKE
jgi:hypothetical protein